MTPHSDSESLARRLASREPSAFLEFASIFGPKIYKYLIKMGLPDADAEELAGDLVTDIELKADKYRTGSFPKWVFAIVRNAFCDWKREHLFPAGTLDEEIENTPLYEGEFASNPEVDQVVQNAVARLNQLDRTILQLRYHGKADTYAEIGRYLGLKEETIRTRHWRALKKLEHVLEKHPLIKKRNASRKEMEINQHE